MNPDPIKNIELIEAYYEGHLDATEKLRVEELLATSQEFREEYELYLSLVSGIKSQNEDMLRKGFSKIDRDLNAPKRVFRIGGSSLSIAAMLLVFFIGGVLWYYYANYSTHAVFRAHYIEDPGLPVLMSGEGQRQFDEAMSLYKLKEYKASLDILNKLSSHDPANDTLLYYSGVNLLMLEKPEAAEIYLKHVNDMSDSEFQKDAEYRYAVCMWLEGKHEEAIVLLNAISIDKDSEYQESAMKMMGKAYLSN